MAHSLQYSLFPVFTHLDIYQVFHWVFTVFPLMLLCQGGMEIAMRERRNIIVKNNNANKVCSPGSLNLSSLSLDFQRKVLY